MTPPSASTSSVQPLSRAKAATSWDVRTEASGTHRTTVRTGSAQARVEA